ncbi:cupin domain-containing protein [Aminobacter sp. Piv2-1]|uniref:cupin domain-containing protein n=1 Tax=Aminobacter sp. Piv2-1 TaxID=3031122 RepID=UPI0030EF8657
MQPVVHTDHAREQWRAGVESRMLVSAGSGARQLCIFEQWVAPGAGAPTHFHPVEEVLTVLAGEAEVWFGDEHAKLVAGQSMIVPAGQSHGFRNPGEATLHMHAVLASSEFVAIREDTGETIRRWGAAGPEAESPGRPGERRLNPLRRVPRGPRPRNA